MTIPNISGSWPTHAWPGKHHRNYFSGNVWVRKHFQNLNFWSVISKQAADKALRVDLTAWNISHWEGAETRLSSDYPAAVRFWGAFLSLVTSAAFEAVISTQWSHLTARTGADVVLFSGQRWGTAWSLLLTPCQRGTPTVPDGAH